MKISVPLLILSLAASASAQEWAVTMKAVKGRESYSYTLENKPGKAASYDGKAAVRGGAPAREISFDYFLNQPKGGYFRVDYNAEVSGPNRARPLFQAGGKVLLRPGKPVLAAEASGWKLVLEIEAPSQEKYGKPAGGTLKARLKCRRDSYPARFTYLPDEQYSAVLFSEEDGFVRKFLVGLLPGTPGMDGSFFLQYTLLLAEAGAPLASAEGKMVLKPGAGERSVPAGKDCVFYAAAAD